MPRKDLIQIRQGTTEQWATANPVLALAEPGLDTTVDRVKYGDGVTAWSDLPWDDGLPVTVTVDPSLAGLAVHYGPGPLPAPGTMPGTIYVVVPT